MGRSQLQGTPWHYEYANGNSTSNSKNCAFNTGKRCACKASSNHNNSCIGKLYCEEFERSSFRRTNTNKRTSTKSTSKTNQTIQNRPNKSQQQSKTNIVQLGDKIVVQSILAKENVNFRVTDEKNPFYLKKLNSTVSIKGRQYRIIEIIKY